MNSEQRPFSLNDFLRDWKDNVDRRNIEKPWLNKTKEEKKEDDHYVKLMEDLEGMKNNESRDTD